MKAILVEKYGSIDNVVMGSLPDPTPLAGQVIVKVQAAPVQFVDMLVITGKYQFLPPTPFSPGKGPAGIVTALGQGVQSLAIGDRVLAMAEEGGYSEQVAVDAQQCYRLPETMSFEDAASLSLAFDTAWFALRDRARVKAGETVLVLGASGAVGIGCMQLAKAMGARVLAGVSSGHSAELAMQYGADATIDLRADNLRENCREQVYAANEGRGVDVVIDMLGDDIFAAAIRALAWRGRMVVVGFAAGSIPTIKANYLLLKNIEVSGLQVSDYRTHLPAMMTQCFEEIFSFYQSGKIKAPKYTAVPFNDFPTALKLVFERLTKDRVVLVHKG
jgi:NADPH2:quinone reductase